MDDDEIVARADANYFAAMATFVGSTKRGEVRAKDGMLACYSGTNVASFNIGFVLKPLDDAPGAIAGVMAFFDERKVPFILRMREGLDPAFEDAVRAAGLRYTDTVPGMALFPPEVKDAEIDGLQIRRIDDDHSLDDHRAVVAEAFEMPIELARYFVTHHLLKRPDVEGYVAYMDDRAVATSALFLTHRVGGVYNVATVPEYRGRGIGEAVTRHAVQRGVACDCVMAGLQASEMGQPVYERMGFRTVSPYRTYARPDQT
jgi:ribosomal protein S18 acetylase RimI-like enzyme